MSRLITILSFLCSLVSFSQEARFSNEYYLNPFLANPAAAGLENHQVLNISYKRQWMGLQDSPGIQLISITNRIGNMDFYNPRMMINKSNFVSKNRIGFGVCIYNDKNGPLSFQGVLFAYSYHIPFRFSRLSFGLSASLTQHLLDQTKFESYYPDGSLSYTKERFFFPNSAFGMAFHNHTYYIGLSVNQVLPVNNDFVSRFPSKNDYSLFGSYKFNIPGIFDLEPSLMLKMENHDTWCFDVHNKIYIYQYYWFSLSYNMFYSQPVETFGNAVELNMGIKVMRNIYLSYGYQSNIGDVVRYFGGAHHFSLGTNIGLRGVQGVRKFVTE